MYIQTDNIRMLYPVIVEEDFYICSIEKLDGLRSVNAIHSIN